MNKLVYLLERTLNSRSKKLTKQEMADLIAAEKEHFSDPKNKPKRSKTLTVNMTKEEKEKQRNVDHNSKNQNGIKAII